LKKADKNEVFNFNFEENKQISPYASEFRISKKDSIGKTSALGHKSIKNFGTRTPMSI
jgi:hypothetical protein